VVKVAEKLCSIYGISEEKVGEITSKNALEVYQINE
jgi:Tat protein secretion system quality control protein TatD with DNase activity